MGNSPRSDVPDGTITGGSRYRQCRQVANHPTRSPSMISTRNVSTGTRAGGLRTSPVRMSNREPWRGHFDGAVIELAVAERIVFVRAVVAEGVEAAIISMDEADRENVIHRGLAYVGTRWVVTLNQLKVVVHRHHGNSVADRRYSTGGGRAAIARFVTLTGILSACWSAARAR